MQNPADIPLSGVAVGVKLIGKNPFIQRFTYSTEEITDAIMQEYVLSHCPNSVLEAWTVLAGVDERLVKTVSFTNGAVSVMMKTQQELQEEESVQTELANLIEMRFQAKNLLKEKSATASSDLKMRTLMFITETSDESGVVAELEALSL